MSRILVTAAAALALAVPGTAAAHGRPPHKPKPPKPPTSPPVVVVPAGEPDRAGYCVDGVFLDLLKDQPLLDPTDPRWAYKAVRPANVGLPGNDLAIWC